MNSSSPRLGFGGFLLGLGAGWIIFTYFEVSSNVFSWLLILAGAGVIISTLISQGRPRLKIGGLVGGLMGGLILSLFITSGFGIIGDITRGGISATYRFKDTASYSGAVSEARVYLVVDNFNGPVSVSTWGEAEYKVDLSIGARREEYLDDLKIEFGESITQGQKRLSLGYDILPTEHSRYAIEVEVLLPADAVIGLDLSSSNGGIYLTEITGDTLTLATSNGAIEFDDVLAERINGATSNGQISGRVEAPDTVLSTSNGRIELTLPCTVTGEYVLSTSNGAIDLEVSSSEVGYSLDLSTSNGRVDVDLPNLSYTTDQRTRKVARTTGFDAKDVRITINGSTSNSNVDVGT
ncbi:MAG: DUF4097 family beta strand repeat protein [Candidatus Bathyarchaeota archaeon]|nr:MAG: DUF4097 family beta strand repeat protein [Candidatus Bathyarchaeota archaeon]